MSNYYNVLNINTAIFIYELYIMVGLDEEALFILKDGTEIYSSELDNLKIYQ